MSTLNVDRMTPSGEVPAPQPQASPRYWPAVAIVAAFWVFHFALKPIELTMFQRFVTRMIGMAVLLLLFLVWWLTNGRVSRSNRWLAVGAMFGVFALMGFVTDKTLNHFGLLFSALPFVLTAWAVWLLASRHLSQHVQRVGFVAAMVVSFGFFALVRWDGLNGAQEAALNWRWSPTAEQRFLAERAAKGDSAQAEKTPVARTLSLKPGDWPEFRGGRRDSQVHGVRLSNNWEKSPPPLVWKQRVGPGWSSVCIVDDVLFTQEQRGEAEVTVCYEAATGHEIWMHTDSTRFFEALSGAGPRSTPTFADGKLFTFGATGKLDCLDAATGKLLWSHDLVAETKAAVPQWGFSDSPLVVDDMVVVFAGGEGDKGLMAYRIDTGDMAWSAPSGKQSYSSPQLLTLGGKRQVLMLSEQSLKAVDPATGAALWELENDDKIATPIVQPQKVGEHELLAAWGEGMSLLEVQEADGKWSVTRRWTSKGIKPSFNDVVVHDGFIYGFDDGIFCCVELANGKRRWKRGRYGFGQVLLLADEPVLLVISEKGEAVLVEPNPEKLVELGRFQAITGKTWNHPVVAHGRLYARNDEELACYDLTGGALR
jgi:outer membrane protein assembly factor BamB